MTNYHETTHKATIHGDNGVQVTVIRNLSTAQDFSSAALWLKRESPEDNGSKRSGFYDTYGIEAARELHKNIGIVLAELDEITESAKPKPATAAELTRAVMGTKAYALGLSPADEGTVWLRVRGGAWAVIEDGGRTHRIGDLYESGILEGLVVLNPEEVN